MEASKKHIIDSLEVAQTPLPDDQYFADFRSSVLAKTLPSEKQGSIVPLYKRWYSWGAAAAILLIALFINGLYAPQTAPETEPSFSELSKDDILDYFHENPEELDETLLAEQLPESAIWSDSSSVKPAKSQTTESPQQKKQTKTQSFDELDRKEIFDYFQEEGYDFDDELLID